MHLNSLKNYIPNNNPIIILGMHRSGTSIMGGVLSRLGVDMGKELVGKRWSNPLGHFEDKEFLSLNNRILEAAGGGWDAPPVRDAIQAQKDNFTEEIKDVIRRKRSSLWGWKDPRTSLTIKLYLPYLTNPYFIVCQRDHQAIAKSLRRRDNMEIEEGIRLAKIYEERINDFFKANPKLRMLDIAYEEMLAVPEKQLKRTIDFLEIRVSQEQYQEALKFVLPKEKIDQLSKKVRAKERIEMVKKAVTKPWKIARFILREIWSKIP